MVVFGSVCAQLDYSTRYVYMWLKLKFLIAEKRLVKPSKSIIEEKIVLKPSKNIIEEKIVEVKPSKSINHKDVDRVSFNFRILKLFLDLVVIL